VIASRIAMPGAKPEPAWPVRIGVLLWTERTAWSAFREAAVVADQTGVDSIWLSDHLFAATGPETDPCFEAWTALSALAALTSRATVGSMVGAVGLRNPGVLAKMLTTVDHISGGRGVCGLGAGWLQREYAAHGIDWEDKPADRVARLEEAVILIRRLINGERVSHCGRFYELSAAYQAPRPVREHIPLLIGGEGRKFTLGVVARHADMWNARGSASTLARHAEALRAHCVEAGRDVGTIEMMTNRWIAIRPSHAEAEQVLSDGLMHHGIESFDPGITAFGPLSAVADSILPTVKSGFRHLVFSFRSPFDLDTIARLPSLRERLSEHMRAQ
jgi:alkanesulfonate monooxygenase SsuD/methylene tetrahydromethanopterin reductase-like flavin-dependent oxidoreductase (luciferase family)